jgi:pyruvate dehydrogenase E1 component beta subunit
MEITYSEAILLAQKQILVENNKSLVLGINVSSPDAVFGTVKNLIIEFGSNRVIETPASENAITGICMGLATAGYLPILVHQRMDFAILSFDMIINQLAKWNICLDLIQRPNSYIHLVEPAMRDKFSFIIITVRHGGGFRDDQFLFRCFGLHF